MPLPCVCVTVLGPILAVPGLSLGSGGPGLLPEPNGCSERLALMGRQNKYDQQEASDVALLAGIFLLFMFLVTVIAFILS